jgi:hypothetical protein
VVLQNGGLVMWLAIALGAVLAGWGVLGVIYRRELVAAWREPVLKCPVLIVESDDWGPGPATDAARLDALLDVLHRHRDHCGRSPVVTIGVLLGVADTDRMRAASLSHYHRLRLDDPRFGSVLDALRRGRDSGILALHLHGMEHYWPPAVLAAAASGDEAARRWLETPGVPRHEALPPRLQSRWCDASTQPSRPVPRGDADRAVEEELDAFAAVLGEPAAVVVPPTFIWNADTEVAWAARGVRVIVTPGRRWVGHRTDGSLVADRASIYNGEVSPCGITYVVRDDYFEPARGHRAESGLKALAAKTVAGRPTLVEMHRSNLTGDATTAAGALTELDRLLGMALARFPGLRFMSTWDLVTALHERRPELVQRSLRHRLRAWLVRVGRLPRLRKLAWATGLIIPVGLILLLTRGTQPGNRLAGACR